MTKPRTVPLDAESPIDDFESREAAIQDFLRAKARDFQAKALCRTFLLKRDDDDHDQPIIVGFYAIFMGAFQARDLPAATRDALPIASIPVAMIGQIGRDRRTSKERKFGDVLLADVLSRVIALAEEIGCWGIALDAMNAGLVERYKQMGFKSVGAGFDQGRQTQRMFLPLETAKKASAAVDAVV